MLCGLTEAEINRVFWSMEKYKKFRKDWCEACVKINKCSKNKEIIEEMKRGGKKNGSKRNS